MNYRAIITDLDGTLLNPQSQLTPFTVEILNVLARQGIQLVFATGRHPDDAANYAKQLDYPVSIIGLNGAMSCQQGNIIALHHLNAEVVDRIAALAQMKDAHVNLFSQQGWMLFEANEMAKGHVDSSAYNYQIIAREQLPSLKVCKILLWREDGVAELEKQIKQHFANQIVVYSTSPQQLEIGPKKRSKTIAAIELLAKKNICFRTQAIAFGDGENDIELLQQAAKGVVMLNAALPIKTALNTLSMAPCHSADGVAHYLKKLFKI